MKAYNSIISLMKSRCFNARRHHYAGFSLIELMISMVLGLVVMAAVLALFLNLTRSNTELSKMNQQIENGRFAIQILQSDLEHAGF